MRKAFLPPLLALLLPFFLPTAVGAETYMLLVEERRDGQAKTAPLPSLEGLMAGMFELGQVTFDTGPYHPEADWARQRFTEPLAIAREGGAHYLSTVWIECRSLSAEDASPSTAPSAFEATAACSLWGAGTGLLLGRSERVLDNRGRERELPLESLLFRLGELCAEELTRLARPGR